MVGFSLCREFTTNKKIMSKIIFKETDDTDFRRAMRESLKNALLNPEYIGQKVEKKDKKWNALHIGDIILYPASVKRPDTYIISHDGARPYLTRMLTNGALFSVPLDWYDDFILDAKYNA